MSAISKEQYSVEIVLDKLQWELSIGYFPEANFLQSWNWGLFQEQLGKRVKRVLISDRTGVIALAQSVVEPAKRGQYLALAGGPLVDWNNRDLVAYLFDSLFVIAKESNCNFIRFRPQALSSNVEKVLLDHINARPAPMHLTADLTLQLDITESDELILQQMRKNTRSSIRKSQKIGITTTVSADISEIAAFHTEQEKLAVKQHFVPFSYTFFYEQFKAFQQDNQCCLIHAFSQDGEKLATAFLIFYNHEAVYHYGISTELNQKLPGSYACQWRSIQEAKKRGCQRYNFWGVVPEGITDHRFSGVSLFKRGFGGEEVNYVPAHDIIVTQKYWLSYIFEIFRRKYRRL